MKVAGSWSSTSATPSDKIVAAKKPPYLIGIDLGTTQSALAWLDTDNPEAGISFFSVPQFVSAREVASQPTLPSLLYLPEEGLSLPGAPWGGDEGGPIVGECARELGAHVPSRLVHSAKSWLSHPKIDRQAPILPWQSDTVSEKLSPVQASAAYLRHLMQVWNHVKLPTDPDAEFSRQEIVITVPASFDPSARNLTLEAITLAGYPAVTLLEEPQAAFYDYLARRATHLKNDLAGVKTVLVIDIGGGTSDFSLIGVEWPKGSSKPAFTRKAVGPHLLIGGDNLDLAVARLVEARLKHRGKRLVTRQWLSLISRSRAAKEQTLADDSVGAVAFTISGAGSSVLAGTLKENLEKASIRETLLEGFFPRVGADARPTEDGGFGLSEAGLPYSRDPAITRHLAGFLADQQTMPDALLFNGGTLNAPALRDRLVEILTDWRGEAPLVLENPHPTLAVASGAVGFSMARHGIGERIRSGNPVSLYLGVGTAANSRPDKHIPQELLCLLPKGAENEREERIDGAGLALDRSRDAAFYVYFTGSPGGSEQPGERISFNSRKHKALPPLYARAERDAKAADAAGAPSLEPVDLAVVLRETGYLEIAVKGRQTGLSRDLRLAVGEREKKEAKTGGTATPATGATKRAKQALSRRQATQIKQLFDACFAETEADRVPFSLVYKKLEEILELPRKDWEMPTLRAMFDLVAADERFSAGPETFVQYFRLAGYLLRPGFGAANDDERIDRLWELHEREFTTTNTEFWSEWWLLWKRVGAGLSMERQQVLLERIEPLLFASKKTRDTRKVEQHERNHLWRLLGQLERLPVSTKERLGTWIAKYPPTFSKDLVALYALGRLGARDLLYADHTLLVSQGFVQQWTEELLKHSTANLSYLDWALRELGRKVGDRLVQIDEQLRRKIIELLKKHARKKEFIAPLHTIKRAEEADFAESVGEAMPSGFVWLRVDDDSSAGEEGS